MNGVQNSHAIEIHGLSFAYPDGREALRNISLNVRPREKVALVGPNGAGKSTLILQLNGMLTGTGEVRIFGENLAGADKKTIQRIRALVGLVFQDPDDQLFSPTVHDDVAFGPIYMGLEPSTVEERVNQALTAVGMPEYGPRMPHHLSGGEKRRAAIATVLSMAPEIIAADEPSAGLDPRARRGLIRLLDALPQTILVATHDLGLVRDVLPRTIIMDAGELVADGPTADILRDEALLEAHGLEMP
ncbi:MAG: ATP-binding cassette domain-containing protein [Dehalococcoidia bacterium]